MSAFPRATYNATPPTVGDKKDAPLQSDANGNLKVAVAGTPALTPQSSVTTLAEVTTGANTTPGQFGALAATHGVIVQAHPTNTINVRIGGSNTSATRGIALAPGKAVFLPVTDASAIYYCNESATASKLEVLAV